MLPAPRHITTVTGANGVLLHVPEWGDPNGVPLILIHGWSQAHPCWEKQLSGALDGFRLIAPDLRGHGLSDKPDGAEQYDHSQPWADDLQAILDALKIDKAVLVGWSMGGKIVLDYLRVHGEARVAGYCLVGSSSMTGRYVAEQAQNKRNDPDVRATGMVKGSLDEDLTATLAFLRACFHQQPEPDALARMMGYNMLCPQDIRHASRLRHDDYGPDLAHLTVPCLAIWGKHERVFVSPMPEDTLAALPNIRGLFYNDSGHAPFYEEAARFNADLAAFATACLTEEALP